ncbi:hypothetical protein P691DRAFT_774677 [Macrolepiota fuliginosa MF-IS2]|uniref:Uncharacterized protein n=1 Tax=Macrolepiota fuliginosa MF-IS2 TaxID=1400762 RepID=A0A9P5XFK5_9AGAR|nr:hypothetical protein P691DRAFT_774677 [Macrolepiota fuliginosa MF-IS2]
MALPQPTEDLPIPVKLQVDAFGRDIFNGIILTKGRDVTTTSGGTRECDGTNNGAHKKAGATPTSALADAAHRAKFTFDGEWFDEFDDFLITEIGGVSCNWLIRRNGVIIDVGGCQEELDRLDDVLFSCT